MEFFVPIERVVSIENLTKELIENNGHGTLLKLNTLFPIKAANCTDNVNSLFP